jgi:hypothetical protein
LACGHAGSSIAAVAAVAAGCRSASGLTAEPSHTSGPTDSGRTTLATSSCDSNIPTSASHRTIEVRRIARASITAVAGSSGRAAETSVTTAAVGTKSTRAAAAAADTTHTTTATITTVSTGLRRLAVGSIRAGTSMAANATIAR